MLNFKMIHPLPERIYSLHGESFKEHINKFSNKNHANMKIDGTDCDIFAGNNFYIKQVFYVKNSIKFVLSDYDGAKFFHNWMFLVRMSFNSTAKKDRLERWNIGKV